MLQEWLWSLKMTRTKKIKGLFSLTILLVISIAQTSCQYSYTRLEFERGRKASEEKKFDQAIKHYDRVVSRDPDSNLAIVSAIKAAQLLRREIKDYSRAIYYYKHVIRHSDEQKIAIKVQKKIADLYFENLGDYKSAIDEFSKLLKTTEKNSDLYIDSKLKIAKSYFYLNNFFQAKTEATELLKEVDDSEKTFELKQFLANIHFNTKNIEEAIKLYKELNKDYPQRSRDENIPMSIVVCYEELKQFDDAIAELKQIKPTYPTPEFIDFKINRLKERIQNLPRRR